MIDSSKLKIFSHNTIVLVAFYFISRLYVTGYWPSGCVFARPVLCHWFPCSPSCCLESICHCSPFWIHTIPFHFSCTGSSLLFLCSLFLILLTLLRISVSPPPYSNLGSWMCVYLYFHTACIFNSLPIWSFFPDGLYSDGSPGFFPAVVQLSKLLDSH